MPKLKKAIKILISVQILVISSLIPAFISIPFSNKIIQTYEFPITWQIPSVIIMTLIFKAEILFKAFSIYLVIGLFFIPVFQNGGSLGYLLTPNFGYLLGLYPLIKIIDLLNKKNRNIDYYNFIKFGILGIISMHITGLIYIFFQMIYSIKPNILIYNFSIYSLGKFGYHILMLTPIILLIKPINKYRCQK